MRFCDINALQKMWLVEVHRVAYGINGTCDDKAEKIYSKKLYGFLMLLRQKRARCVSRCTIPYDLKNMV